MDHDGVHAHQFHQHDIPGKTVLQFFVHHGVAAKFDHNGLAGKALNVGQRLGQYLSHVHGLGAVQ